MPQSHLRQEHSYASSSPLVNSQEKWSLDLSGDVVTLRDPAGSVHLECAPDEAVQRFQMPSFSESIKHFGVYVGDHLLEFQPLDQGLAEIKSFLNRRILIAGPEAVFAVKNAAIRDTLIGAAVALGSIVLTVGSFIAAAKNPEGGSFHLLMGLSLFGLVMFGKGIYGFVQYRRILRLAEEVMQGKY